MLETNQITSILSIMMAVAIPISFIIYWFLKNNLKLRQLELAQQVKQEMIPTRLQAYERLSILLERISPEALVLREQSSGSTNLEFHRHLLKVIRTEVEHNLAMQIYIPQSTWELIIKSRNEVIKLINSTANEINPNNTSLEMAKLLLEKTTQGTNYHIKKAMKQIKDDMAKYFFD